MSSNPVLKLLSEPLRIVNIGIKGFADAFKEQQVPVVQVDWMPPAGGDPETVSRLASLESRGVREKTDQAKKLAKAAGL